MGGGVLQAACANPTLFSSAEQLRHTNSFQVTATPWCVHGVTLKEKCDQTCEMFSECRRSVNNCSLTERRRRLVCISTCKRSDTSAGAPECCGSASCAETERSPPAHGADRPATPERRERAPEVGPRGPPTASVVVSASSDSSLTSSKSPGCGLKVAPGSVRLPPGPLHHLPSVSDNI